MVRFRHLAPIFACPRPNVEISRTTSNYKFLVEFLNLTFVRRDCGIWDTNVKFTPLVAEYSMEEFIEPGLPAHVVRRILQNRWALQSLEGKDAGVKLGLSLLGADVTITQWYQMQPKGAANTHRINCMIEDAIWPVEEGRFGPRQISAMWRMINRTKRFSQDTELRIGVSAKGKAFIGIYLGTSMRATAPAIIPPPPIVTLPAAQALVPTALLAATARTLP